MGGHQQPKSAQYSCFFHRQKPAENSYFRDTARKAEAA
jgi:hypothetical protein